MKLDLETLKYDEHGLIPAIIQSVDTGRVLMLAYMNQVSLKLSIETGRTVFFSRSRQELWHKGSTSGNFQTISEIQFDCDADALLIMVQEHGPACHTNTESCFDSGTYPNINSQISENTDG